MVLARRQPEGELRSFIERLDAESNSSRIGVLLGFTQNAKKFEIETFSEFGVGSVHIFSPPGGVPSAGAWLTADQMGLPHSLTAELKTLKDNNNELVIVAFIPKIVAVALGFELTQQGFRFFAGIHLLHFGGGSTGFIPMRAHPSQPATRPASSL